MQDQKMLESPVSILDDLVAVNRVTKVVAGGRKLSFSACVIVGDQSGSVGYGHGKAKEVSDARTKAFQSAKKNMMKVPLLDGRTVYHDVMGHFGAGRVLVRKAPPGTGVIAGGPLRSVFKLLGIRDVVAKSLGSSNVYVVVGALFDALRKVSAPQSICNRRGKLLNN
jgi:small subunit ribosomal protein S5